MKSFASLLMLGLVAAMPVAPRDENGNLTFLDVIDVAVIVFNIFDPTLRLIKVTCIAEGGSGSAVPYQSLTNVTFEARNDTGYSILPANPEVGFGTIESYNHTLTNGEENYKPLDVSVIDVDFAPAADLLLTSGIFEISPTASPPNIFHQASLVQGIYRASDGTLVEGPIWTFSLDFGSTCFVYMDGSSACSNVE